MFEDSLLESGNRFKTKRGATTALSVALQSLLLGAMVLLPLIYIEALPRFQMLGALPTPPPAAPPRGAPTPRQPTAPVISEFHDGRLLTPIRIPPHALAVEDAEAPSTSGPGVPWGVVGSPGPNDSSNPLVSILTPHAAPPPPEPRAERIIVSRGVTEGHLIRRVAPEYPALARQGRIEGDVLIRAVIGRDGSIENLALVSGHPFLARAALDAVRQWQYQPFLLNGRPVEVDTQIVVRFRLTKD